MSEFQVNAEMKAAINQQVIESLELLRLALGQNRIDQETYEFVRKSLTALYCIGFCEGALEGAMQTKRIFTGAP